MNSSIKSHRLKISRMAGQVRKIENPETLPKERFLGANLENIIPIFLEFKVFEKFAKKENMAFCLVNM